MKEEKITLKSRTKNIIEFSLFVLILVLILLLHSCSNIGQIDNDSLVPTGNIDIFDIVIDKSCCSDKKDTCNCNCMTFQEQDETKTELGISDETKTEPENYEEERTGLEVYDNTLKYGTATALNMFSNPAYEFNNIIAPDSSNVYQFIVRNNNDFNIIYDISMSENNEYNINMMYRLMLDGEYVAGDEEHWVKYDELQLRDIRLASKAKDVYQLQWKWFENENDTYVGSIQSDYSLNINFYGKEA